MGWPKKRRRRHLGRIGWAVVAWSVYCFLLLMSEGPGPVKSGPVPSGVTSRPSVSTAPLGIGQPAVIVIYVAGLVGLWLLSRFLRSRRPR